jgi:hypothetical protein
LPRPAFRPKMVPLTSVIVLFVHPGLPGVLRRFETALLYPRPKWIHGISSRDGCYLPALWIWCITVDHCWDTGKRAWIKGSMCGLFRIDELGASDRCRTGLFESYCRLRAWSCDLIGHLASEWSPTQNHSGCLQGQQQPSQRSAVCTGCGTLYCRVQPSAKVCNSKEDIQYTYRRTCACIDIKMYTMYMPMHHALSAKCIEVTPPTRKPRFPGELFTSCNVSTLARNRGHGRAKPSLHSSCQAPLRSRLRAYGRLHAWCCCGIWWFRPAVN